MLRPRLQRNSPWPERRGVGFWHTSPGDEGNEWPLTTHLRRPNWSSGATGMGAGRPVPPPGLNGRCRYPNRSVVLLINVLNLTDITLRVSELSQQAERGAGVRSATLKSAPSPGSPALAPRQPDRSPPWRADNPAGSGETRRHSTPAP